MLRKLFLPVLFLLPGFLMAQEGAVISGALQVNANVF